MTDLGTLPGGKSSAAIAINENNQIVGWGHHQDRPEARRPLDAPQRLTAP